MESRFDPKTINGESESASYLGVAIVFNHLRRSCGRQEENEK